MWISFWFHTLHVVSHGEVQPGASDRTQSDNIWLDRVSVCTCIYFPCVTSDCAWSWDHARPQPCGRPRQCAQAFMENVFSMDIFWIYLSPKRTNPERYISKTNYRKEKIFWIIFFEWVNLFFFKKKNKKNLTKPKLTHEKLKKKIIKNRKKL